MRHFHHHPSGAATPAYGFGRDSAAARATPPLKQREVSVREGETLARRLLLPVPFHETSARTGENVDEAFEAVIRAVLKSQGRDPDSVGDGTTTAPVVPVATVPVKPPKQLVSAVAGPNAPAQWTLVGSHRHHARAHSEGQRSLAASVKAAAAAAAAGAAANGIVPVRECRHRAARQYQERPGLVPDEAAGTTVVGDGSDAGWKSGRGGGSHSRKGSEASSVPKWTLAGAQGAAGVGGAGAGHSRRPSVSTGRGGGGGSGGGANHSRTASSGGRRAASFDVARPTASGALGAERTLLEAAETVVDVHEEPLAEVDEEEAGRGRGEGAAAETSVGLARRPSVMQRFKRALSLSRKPASQDMSRDSVQPVILGNWI